MAEEIIDLRDRIEKMRIQIENEATEQISVESPYEIHQKTNNSNISISMEKKKSQENQNFDIKNDYPNMFLLGIAHKDDPKDSKKYLSQEGNPYSFVGIDQNGKIALEFGVFGLPETFIINDDGKIIFKHTGPLTKKIIDNEISVLF